MNKVYFTVIVVVIVMMIIVDYLSVYANHAACRIVDGGCVVQLPIRAFFWYGTWNKRSWLHGTVQCLPVKTVANCALFF